MIDNAMISAAAAFSTGPFFADPAVPHAAKTAGQAEKAARDFEAVFLGQMLKHIFSGIETDPVFGGGHGETVFRGLLIDEIGKQIADTGGIGIADRVRQDLLRVQEGKRDDT